MKTVQITLLCVLCAGCGTLRSKPDHAQALADTYRDQLAKGEVVRVLRDADPGPPPLNITVADVPVPVVIPYSDAGDIAGYTEFYKKAYVFVANHEHCSISRSCCLFGDVPNREAKIRGHYAGQEAGRKARTSGSTTTKSTLSSEAAPSAAPSER